MTMPDQDGMQATIFIKLDKIGADVAGISTDVAVIKTELRILPDHESRIREMKTQLDQQSGSRDTVSRILAALALVAALVSAYGVWIHR